MKSNNEVFIRYLYNNDHSFTETVPLSLVLNEFETYKLEAYEDWVDSESPTLPRQLYEITHLGFDKNMKLQTIEFSEKGMKYVK